MHKVYSGEPLDSIVCKNGYVWLRKNQTEQTDDEGNIMYEADEVTFKTKNTKSLEGIVIEQFNELWNKAESKSVSSFDVPDIDEHDTYEDRLADIENALIELAEIIAEV